MITEKPIGALEAGEETSGDGDGDTAGDGDGDSGGDGDGDTGGDGDCLPPEGADFSYEPLDFGVISRGGIDIDWTCTVTEADTSDGLTLTLDCPEATKAVTLDISATPQLVAPVSVQDEVRVRYVLLQKFWANHYLRLEVVGSGHLLTLIDGDSLTLPPEYEFEEPLMDLQAEPRMCPWEIGPCGELERLALTFDALELSELFDGQHGSFGTLPKTDVWVAEAQELHSNCQDVPPGWYRLLVVNSGWD